MYKYFRMLLIITIHRHGSFKSYYLFYPVVSVLLVNSFSQMVTYILPCPVISISIAVYAGYKRKNKVLLALLTIWGLIGIKSVIFNAYEDIILLACGLHGIILFVSKKKQSKKVWLPGRKV